MFRFTTKDVWIASRVKQFKIVEHPGAAATLVVDGDRVLLVEQYRPAAERYMFELPAGTKDLDEDPLTCAQRELAEETGYTAAKWESLGYVYPTPGYTTEVLHLFLAEEISAGEQRLDDGEDILVRWMPIEEVEKMIADGVICDAKTIIAMYRFLSLRKKCNCHQ